MSGNNIFSSFPFTQSDPGFGPGAPRGAGGAGGWEIEAFPFGNVQIGEDPNAELWHSADVASGGLGFFWIIPRIGFTEVSSFSSCEYSPPGATPGQVCMYGFPDTYSIDTHIADFPKGLTGSGNYEPWKHDIGIDVSMYAFIAFFMDPLWISADADTGHLVSQIGSPVEMPLYRYAGLAPKTVNAPPAHLIPIISLIQYKSDPKFALTHWMKVGVK